MVEKGSVTPELTEAMLGAVAPEVMESIRGAQQASSVAPIPPDVQQVLDQQNVANETTTPVEKPVTPDESLPSEVQDALSPENTEAPVEGQDR